MRKLKTVIGVIVLALVMSLHATAAFAGPTEIPGVVPTKDSNTSQNTLTGTGPTEIPGFTEAILFAITMTISL
jgi:hypothetical protein